VIRRERSCDSLRRLRCGRRCGAVRRGTSCGDGRCGASCASWEGAARRRAPRGRRPDDNVAIWRAVTGRCRAVQDQVPDHPQRDRACRRAL